MLDYEYSKLMGYNATQEEYVEANAIYMSTTLNKEDFCKAYKKVKDNPIITALMGHIESLEDISKRDSEIHNHALTVYQGNTDMLIERLLLTSNMVNDTSNEEAIIKVLGTGCNDGHRKLIKRKLDLGIALSETDTDYLKEIL